MGRVFSLERNASKSNESETGEGPGLRKKALDQKARRVPSHPLGQKTRKTCLNIELRKIYAISWHHPHVHTPSSHDQGYKGTRVLTADISLVVCFEQFAPRTWQGTTNGKYDFFPGGFGSNSMCPGYQNSFTRQQYTKRGQRSTKFITQTDKVPCGHG